MCSSCKDRAFFSRIELAVKLTNSVGASGRLLLYGIEEYFKQNNSFPNLVISQDLDFECFVYSLMNFWIHQIPNCYSVQANTLTRKHYLSAKTILIDGYIEWQECKDEAMQILNLN